MHYHLYPFHFVLFQSQDLVAKQQITVAQATSNAFSSTSCRPIPEQETMLSPDIKQAECLLHYLSTTTFANMLI